MRAAVTRSRATMSVVDVPEPGEPGPGEVIVRPEAVGLCGSDFHYFLGDIGLDAQLYPRIQGHEAAGVLEQVGPECPPGLSAGERVAIWPLGSCGRCYPCRIGRAQRLREHQPGRRPPRRRAAGPARPAGRAGLPRRGAGSGARSADRAGLDRGAGGRARTGRGRREGGRVRRRPDRTGDRRRRRRPGRLRAAPRPAREPPPPRPFGGRDPRRRERRTGGRGGPRVGGRRRAGGGVRGHGRRPRWRRRRWSSWRRRGA